MKALNMFGLSAITLALVGCGGGGSEESETLGGSPTVTTEALVTWSSAGGANTNVESDAQTIGSELRTGVITAKGNSPYTGDEVTYEFDSSGELSRIAVGLQTDTGSSSYNTGIWTLTDDGNYVEINEPLVVSVFADPVNSGFEYQSYGAWTEVAMSTERDFYATTFGVVSTEPQIPDSGTATFTGSAAGVYFNETDTATVTVKSDMTASVDFGAGTAAVALSNSALEDPFAGTPNDQTAYVAGMSASDFDIGFTLSNGGDQNATMTTTTVTGGAFGGANFTARGEFYGTTAQEIGGVFQADVTNGSGDKEVFVGGFGGAQ